MSDLTIAPLIDPTFNEPFEFIDDDEAVRIAQVAEHIAARMEQSDTRKREFELTIEGDRRGFVRDRIADAVRAYGYFVRPVDPFGTTLLVARQFPKILEFPVEVPRDADAV